jgi:hypothetical protein
MPTSTATAAMPPEDGCFVMRDTFLDSTRCIDRPASAAAAGQGQPCP